MVTVDDLEMNYDIFCSHSITHPGLQFTDWLWKLDEGSNIIKCITNDFSHSQAEIFMNISLPLFFRVMNMLRG
jgi:hypothetical protein